HDALPICPSATPAAGRIPKTLFIPLLLGFTALPPLDNANSLRARKQGHACQLGEQPMLDDARYRVEQARKAYRLGNAPQMGINNPVAAIGDKNVAVPPLAERHFAGGATFRKGFGNAAPGRGIAKAFAECGASGEMTLRKGREGHVFVTDGGHWIIDAHLGRIAEPVRLSGLLN